VEQALHGLATDDVRARMAAFRPDLVGFSCLSLEADEMERLARAAKEVNPRCAVVLGGPHAKFFYDRALENPDIDAAVVGEGEETFPELLEALEDGRPLDGVKGVAFRRDGRALLTAPREAIEDLDSLPFPAWDLVDFRRYSRVPGMNGYSKSVPWAVVMTSRGCPFRCAYCHDIFGKKARLRSPENVLAEIELLTRVHGVREIHIVDDIFNVDPARAGRICDLIAERGIKVDIAFPNALRVDMMDRDLIRKLKRAGCYAVTYAVETASPRIQALLGKNVDLEKARRVISWTAAEGIITHGFFMIGFPGETREEMRLTEEWALSSDLWLPIFFMAVVYPRTRLFEIARETYPGFDFGDWNMGDLQYRDGVPFYQKATGVPLPSIHLAMVRRGYWKFARRIARGVPFPRNILFLLGLAWWAAPRVFPRAARVQKLFYPCRPKAPLSARTREARA
jgi:radical SAM superfamily enzyme YgiQ (UPF0313 family)